MDSAGDLVLSGGFTNPIDFGNGPLTSAGNFDIYVARFDSSGNAVWSESFGGASSETVSSAAIDADAGIYVAGSYAGALDFGAGQLDAGQGYNAFLAALDPSGAIRWDHSFIVPGNPGFDTTDLGSLGVAVDSSGEPTFSVMFSGLIDFGGGALASGGTRSVALAHYDASGAYRWAYAGGPQSTAYESFLAPLHGIAASPSRVVLAGGIAACTATSCASPGATIVLTPQGTATAGLTLTAQSLEDMILINFAR